MVIKLDDGGFVGGEELGFKRRKRQSKCRTRQLKEEAGGGGRR